jgi:tripartite-type tricarboxylate transporter receptor subunit TctC
MVQRLRASFSMSMKSYARGRLVAICALSLLLAVPLHAQTYPERPITLVVPFGPGSATDIFARVVAQNLAPILRQNVLVDNKPGGNATIAAEAVARAAADGYTLMVSTASAHASNVFLLKELRYDPIKDFEPITRLGIVHFFVAVSRDSPYRTLQDLLDDAKANPGRLSIAQSSASGIVTARALLTWSGVNMIEVPYRSSPQAMTDLTGGRVTAMVADFAAGASQLEAGAIRPLAVTAAKRSTHSPETPTLQELGMEGFDLIGWFGLYAPAKTPRPVLDKLSAAVAEIMAKPELKSRFAQLGYEAFSSTPEQLAAHTKAEIAAWGRYVKAFSIDPQ